MDIILTFIIGWFWRYDGALLSIHSTEWDENEEDAEDEHVWEDSWDDDNIEDDFSNQLRWDLLHN